METLNYDQKCWKQSCPKIDCHKKACKCGLKFVEIPAALGDDKIGNAVPEKGQYCNAIVEYEANGAVYVYSSEGIPVNVKEGE